MAQPDSRKYQLFPRENHNTASSVKVLAPEQAFAVAMGQSTEKNDKFAAGGLRFRIKEHNLSVSSRRRKVSVPELGPMTTVHESSMDSRKFNLSVCTRRVMSQMLTLMKPPYQDDQYFMSAPPALLEMPGNFQTTHPNPLRTRPSRASHRVLVHHCHPRIFLHS